MTRQQSHRKWFESDSTYSAVPREIRPAGSSGVTLVEVHQPPGFFERDAADEFSLNVFLDADCGGTANFGGKRISGRIRSGCLGMAPADEALWFDNLGPMHALILLLPKEIVRRICAECGVDSRAVTFERLMPASVADTLVHVLTRNLWQEASRADPASALFADSAVRLLVTQLLRASGEARPKIASGGLAAWQVKRACDAMDADMAGIGLDELAGIVGLSPTHFSRAFKESVGVSPFNWLRERRMEKAKELLSGSAKPLAEVALELGFSAQPEFTTAFKRATGTTPGAWRRERLF